MKPSAHFLTALTCTALFSGAASLAGAAERVATSPGGRAEIRISDEGGQAHNSVRCKGETLVAASPLGLSLDKGAPLSRNLKIVGTSTRAVDQTYALVVGKARTVRDRFTETTVDFLETGGLQRRLTVVARAYDDGVAFRHVLPDQPALAASSVSLGWRKRRLQRSFSISTPAERWATAYS